MKNIHTDYVQDLSRLDIKIDGMKILFQEKVRLMPVQLEKKENHGKQKIG